MQDKVLDFMSSVKTELDKQEFISNDRNTIYMALFQLSFEHSVSILVLTKENLNSSAYALARPAIESFFRAMWVKHCMEENKLPNLIDKGKFPSIASIIEKLERKITHYKETEFFSKQIKPLISNMHDFTHGGIQSIARQYSGDELTNKRDPKEITALIKLVVFITYQNLCETCESTWMDINLDSHYVKYQELMQLE